MEKSAGEFDFDQQTSKKHQIIDVTYESDSDIDSMKQVFDQITMKRLRSD